MDNRIERMITIEIVLCLYRLRLMISGYLMATKVSTTYNIFYKYANG